MKSGAFPVKAGAACRVSAGGISTTVAEKDGRLSVPLNLDGRMEIAIE